jgi:predicted AlkP superfamily pyrophosphatase or phosphodiesterase
MSASPAPVLPDYAGACIRGVLPAVLAPSSGSRRFPTWFPAVASQATSYVVLVLDGLGWNQLVDRWHLTPTMRAMSHTVITSVAPSTTSTALTCITTGLTPGEHGIVGYRQYLSGDVVNMLRWHDGSRDVRRVHEPHVVQPFVPFLGEDVAVVTKAEFSSTGFTEAHLRSGRHYGWRMPSAIAVTVGERIAAGDRCVYAYYDGVDKVAHEFGFGARYDAELRTADRLVSDVLAAVPADTCVLVTADHGQVQVDEPAIVLHPTIARDVRVMSGEGRFRWLHVAPGRQESVRAAAQEQYGDVAWVVTREQVIDQGWFGPLVSPPVAARLGDVALVTHALVAFDDPREGGHMQLICRHGSLTADEMLVPLLAARGSSASGMP